MMFDLGSDLPDDTLVEMVRLPTRIRNAAKFAGLKTIGDLRQTTDKTFASIPNLGLGSVKWLRAQLSERLSPATASSSATTAKGK
jgi:DNA-directed RNA polymerase alpha subunit